MLRKHNGGGVSLTQHVLELFGSGNICRLYRLNIPNPKIQNLNCSKIQNSKSSIYYETIKAGAHISSGKAFWISDFLTGMLNLYQSPFRGGVQSYLGLALYYVLHVLFILNESYQLEIASKMKMLRFLEITALKARIPIQISMLHITD